MCFAAIMFGLSLSDFEMTQFSLYCKLPINCSSRVIAKSKLLLLCYFSVWSQTGYWQVRAFTEKVLFHHVGRIGIVSETLK